MAQDTKQIEAIALGLFSERSARSFGRNVAGVAKQCFADAETFLATAEQYRAGTLETKPAGGLQLSDVACPNLKKNHPHNLVSRQYGDLKKCEQVYLWLIANPLAETYDELEWDKSTTKLARVLIPEFVSPDLRKKAERGQLVGA